MTTDARDTQVLPRYWSRSISGEGGDILTYAVRGGTGQAMVAGLGVLALLGGAWGAYWLTAEGELTAAGVVFLLLIPGGAVLFGVYCLNIAFWMRTDYLLGGHAFSARTYSLFGDTTRDIPRQAIVAIPQHYSPPSASAATTSPGNWVTFVAHHTTPDGKVDEFALDGMHSAEEARWLGPLLAKWADVPLKRGFGASFEEADRDELPEL